MKKVFLIKMSGKKDKLSSPLRYIHKDLMLSQFHVFSSYGTGGSHLLLPESHYLSDSMMQHFKMRK